MKYNRDELQDKMESEIKNKMEEDTYKANLIQIENDNNLKADENPPKNKPEEEKNKINQEHEQIMKAKEIESKKTSLDNQIAIENDKKIHDLNIMKNKNMTKLKENELKKDLERNQDAKQKQKDLELLKGENEKEEKLMMQEIERQKDDLSLQMMITQMMMVHQMNQSN